MAKKSDRKDKDLLTIEELTDQSGISKALIAKLVRDGIIFPVNGKVRLENMRFHESSLRVIKRWEEKIMGRLHF